VIGPGWLPRPFRPWRKRTLAYTRIRRRSARGANRAAHAVRPVHDEIVIFDRGPYELPVATALPREPRARAVALAIDLGRWLVAPWQWLRPRTVPVMVATLGAIWVLAAANYLAHHADRPSGPATYVQVQIDSAAR
jgi:hypothetical protein